MIDVHAHLGVPEAERLAAADAGFTAHQSAVRARYRDPSTAAHMRSVAPEWERLLTDLGERVTWMDRAGVDVQLVSVNPGQYHYWAAPATAAALVRVINGRLAAAADAHPDRLLALGTVALQHPELAAAQLHHAVHELGMVGVQISTNAAGRDLSAPDLEPLWHAAEECDAVIFLHPLGCPQLTDRLAPAYLNNIVGQPMETTIAISHLIFTGVLDRHPGLRLCAAHGGGYLPHYLGRAEHAYAVRPDSRTMAHPPGHYLRRMWFDSVVHSPAVARSLIDVVGADRLVVGTDYPFDMGDADPGVLIEAIPGLDGAERAAIRTGNVRALLGRHADRLPAPSARPI
ncbi:amidohydrolase family protein [Nonomuraea sp. NEAU-A123]|uniref:amidohydrolase family protein n=1 Tax=Nonomuraea sp. NEAU-A123 TaxID=2839649 RepID=UPI001BE42BE5|nr:amidohydrolase family protein [Nonomuraea sp. NEAU-A123]MBT2225724.1 amidohydrolase family protein [Nonomuraea sp. NEAU-A123]